MKDKLFNRIIALALAAMMALAASGCAETAETAEVLAAAYEEPAWGEVGEIDLYDASIYAGELPVEEPEAVEVTEPAAIGTIEQEAAEASEAVDVIEDAIEAAASDGEEEAHEVPEEEAEAAQGPMALNAAILELGVKETFTLAATFADPETAESVTFASDAPSIASVGSASGKVTAKKAGTAVITASCGEMTATCEVRVRKAPSKVTLNKSKATLGAGEALTLLASLPNNTASALRWASSKPAVATVDAQGRVTAVGTGTANISVKTFNGKKAVCKVTVKAAPTNESMSLGEASMALSVGQVRTLSVSLGKGRAGSYEIISGDESVAQVAGKALTAVGEGETVITARAYNGAQASMTLTVLPAPKALSFTADAVTLGVGEKLALDLACDPCVPMDITYESSRPKVAKVTSSGVIKGMKASSAPVTITATAHNGVKAECVVTVVKAPSKVTLNKSKATLGAGEELSLVATLPGNSSSALTWKSSQPDVATVDPQGRVTALNAGKTNISVKTFNGKKAVCKVTVKVAPTGVILSIDRPVLAVGQTANLSATLNAGSAGAVTYASADEALATVEGNVVTARAPGEVELSVETYNHVPGTAMLTVVPAPEWVALDVDAIDLGVGEKYALSPAINPGSRTDFTYTSDKKSVAKVSGGGTIKGVKPGTATITVETHNGRSASVTVNVGKAPTKVALSRTKLTMELGDMEPLTATMKPGSAVSKLTFVSSDPAVASVDADGMVTAGKIGTAKITVNTFNGLKATCSVTVTAVRTPPKQPGSVSARDVSASALEVTWSRSNHASGYRVYVGQTPDTSDSELYGDYAGIDTCRAALRGLAAGSTCYIFVTAWNDFGESPAAVASAALEEAPDVEPLQLNYEGMIMLRPGATKRLTAATGGLEASDVAWETTTPSVASIQPDGAACQVTAGGLGVATISAELPDGRTASVRVMVVDAADLSDANLAAVQKAILRREYLMNADQGGDVIWDVIAGRLLGANLKQARVDTIIDKVKVAADAFRSLFVYAFGSYDIQGEVTVDKRGKTVSTSYFYPTDNTLYMQRSSLTNLKYAYMYLHETGHAVDYNADGNHVLNSLNNDAVDAIMADVRQVLADRFDAAVAAAGVSAEGIGRDTVIDAVMNYRTLLHEDEVMATMNADERRVYDALVNEVKADMESTLQANNGAMVWDAVEGTTNFAISGSFGHSYMFKNPAYEKLAYYYFYDRQGNPSITSEPWAEFFSANLMGDADTIAANEAWLPRTCQYFAETLLPKALDYFKSWVAGK